VIGGKKGECFYCILTFIENARDKYLPEADVIQVGFPFFLIFYHYYVEKSDVGVIV
jgi:hypothetical protein